NVVAHEIELRQPGIGIKDLLRTGQPNVGQLFENAWRSWSSARWSSAFRRRVGFRRGRSRETFARRGVNSNCSAFRRRGWAGGDCGGRSGFPLTPGPSPGGRGERESRGGRGET